MTSPSTFKGYTTAEEAATKFANEIKGKNVLITGASPGGLGAETARVIAKYAALTIIAGRNLDKLKETEEAIKKEFPEAKIRLLVIDLGDFESVRNAAKEVNEYTEPIDVLINNAAVMQLPTFTTLPGTSTETQFAINHLGPFLFTNLIKPRLASSSSPRIVNVSSGAHRYCSLRPEASFGPKGEEYTPEKAYGQSKTANMLFTVSLAERWKGIGATSFSLHPGILKNIPQRASTTIVAAFDPAILDQSGSYLYDAVVNNSRAMPYEKDKAEADRLWELSETLVCQKF